MPPSPPPSPPPPSAFYTNPEYRLNNTHPEDPLCVGAIKSEVCQSIADSILARSAAGETNGMWRTTTTRDVDALKGDVDVLYVINLLDFVIEICGLLFLVLGLFRRRSAKVGMVLLAFLLVTDVVLQFYSIAIARRSGPIVDVLVSSDCMRKSSEYNTVVGLSGELNQIFIIGLAELAVALIAFVADAVGLFYNQGEDSLKKRVKDTAVVISFALLDLMLASLDFFLFSATAKEESDQLVQSLAERSGAWCVVPTDDAVAFFESQPDAHAYDSFANPLLSVHVGAWIAIIIGCSFAIFGATLCVPPERLERSKPSSDGASSKGAGDASSFRPSQVATFLNSVTPSTKKALEKQLVTSMRRSEGEVARNKAASGPRQRRLWFRARPRIGATRLVESLDDANEAVPAIRYNEGALV